MISGQLVGNRVRVGINGPTQSGGPPVSHRGKGAVFRKSELNTPRPTVDFGAPRILDAIFLEAMDDAPRLARLIIAHYLSDEAAPLGLRLCVHPRPALVARDNPIW